MKAFHLHSAVCRAIFYIFVLDLIFQEVIVVVIAHCVFFAAEVGHEDGIAGPIDHHIIGRDKGFAVIDD